MVRSVYQPSSPTGQVNKEEDADPRLFTHDNKPIYFYLHQGLTSGQVGILKKKINANGGRVCRNLKDLDMDDVLICKENMVDYCRKKYWLEGFYVEDVHVVDRCIKHGKCILHPPVVKGMGGPRPGRSRVEFTREDDENLAQFLARVVPRSQQGGRQSEQLYRTLESKAKENSTFAWGQRHTWQSWKERYKKNRERFDDRITQIVQEKPPRRDGKGRYYLDRRAKRGRLFLPEYDDASNDDDDELDEEEEDEPESELAYEKVYAGMRRRHESEVTDDSDNSMRSPPAKRVRQASGRVSEVEIARNTKEATQSKGKDRDPDPVSPEQAQVDEEENYFGQAGDMAYYGPLEDLPGPSGTQLTPTSASGMRSVPPPAPTQNAMSSQATLVGLVPTQLHGNTARAERSSIPPEDNEVIPATDVEDVDPEPAQSAPSSKAKRMAKKVPSQAAYDGPARNTRARSRSVRPTATFVQPKPRGRRGAAGYDNGTHPTNVDASDVVARKSGRLRHVKEEEEDGNVTTRSRSSVGETQEEEEVADVVAIISGATSSVAASIRSAETRQGAPAASSSRQVASYRQMESDDQQTVESLQRGEPWADIVKNMDELLSPAPPSASRRTSSAARKTASQILRRSESVFSRTTTPSTDDNFPLPGTRARVINRVDKLAAERSPYVPPSGTRADEHMRRLRKMSQELTGSTF